MGQRMLVREGEIGHRIEIQILFEYIYICPRYILSYEKRKIVIKTGEKIRDGRERRIVSAILDHDSRSVFPNSSNLHSQEMSQIGFSILLLLLFILFGITNIKYISISLTGCIKMKNIYF